MRKLTKYVKNKCVVCRKLNKQVQEQRMGQVMSDRMKPTPPFYYTVVDLFGSFIIKAAVKRRTRGKSFGVIFTCLTIRAVCLDLSESYGTEDFLTTFKRFLCIRGYPHIVHSDNGPQLVAANRELREITKNWD